MLSSGSLNGMAKALSEEVGDSIQKDERWVDFMLEVIPEILEQKLGKMDNEVLAELSLCIMDTLALKSYV